MEKFKCVVLRSQYQTVFVDAEDREHAETIAIEAFDPDRVNNHEFMEVYDMEELSDSEPPLTPSEYDLASLVDKHNKL